MKASRRFAKQARGKSSERVVKALEQFSGIKETRREPPPVQFRKPALLTWLATTARQEGKYLVETMIAGVALLDYDNDGWADVFIANGASLPGLEKINPDFYNRLFHNNRDGTFTDVTARARLAGAEVFDRSCCR